MNIQSERRHYLADPTIPFRGYDGELTKGGEHYLYLFKNDPEFGDFLLTVVPNTRDTRIVLAALNFFAGKRPDRAKFEEVVALIDQQMLDEEVDASGADVLAPVPLRDVIESARKSLNSR